MRPAVHMDMSELLTFKRNFKVTLYVCVWGGGVQYFENQSTYKKEEEMASYSCLVVTHGLTRILFNIHITTCDVEFGLYRSRLNPVVQFDSPYCGFLFNINT